MDIQTPAALLERAADHLEELAGKATSGPWVRLRNGNVVSAIRRMTFGLVVAKRMDEVDANWVAALNPAVAAPLVSWLRETGGQLQDEPVQTSDQEYALDLARIILGETT